MDVMDVLVIGVHMEEARAGVKHGGCSRCMEGFAEDMVEAWGGFRAVDSGDGFVDMCS